MDLVLWDFQTESVERLRENIRAGIKNQVLCSATGSGKTVIAAHLLDECNKKGRRGIFVGDRGNEYKSCLQPQSKGVHGQPTLT